MTSLQDLVKMERQMPCGARSVNAAKSASNIVRPVLRYHGGKFGNHGSVADKIIATFPPHRVYVEPFGGAGSVLLRKPRSYGEVYNDRWSDVVRLFRVLRDTESATELERRLRLTPFARDEFEWATIPTDDDIEHARAMIIRSFMGFGSAASNPAYATGFRANSNKSGTTPAHDWSNYPNCLAAITARMQGVTVENRDAGEVIRQHDGSETLFYVDPPYVHETRSAGKKKRNEYVHEMTDDDHRALSEALHDVMGMVVLSGYDCDLYRELYGDWRMTTFAAHADGAKDRTECLWFNDQCWEQQKLPLEKHAERAPQGPLNTPPRGTHVPNK